MSSQQAGIPGLQIHTDIVTPIEEAALLQHIDQQPWTHLAKRRVQHYGYKFEYSQRGVDPKQRLGPLPEWVQPLQRRLEVRVYSIDTSWSGTFDITSNYCCSSCVEDAVVVLLLSTAVA